MSPGIDMERSPRLCHTCDLETDATEARTCALCWRVACGPHLRPASVFNPGTGVYQAAEICIPCGDSA